MAFLPRFSRLLPVSVFIMLSVLAFVLAPAPARADVGVMPILPGGSSLAAEGNTPIQMRAEVVVMDVRLASEADNASLKLNPEAYGYQAQSVWYSAVAEVQADFTMSNPTGEAVSLTAWFPLASTLVNASWGVLNPEEIVPRIEGFQVSVDGSPLEFAVTELPNPQGVDKPPLPWASFPVSFPAGRETMIHVSYVLPLAQPAKSNALVLYYIFQTGAGWAGPIGQAELILNLPYPASAETLSGMPSGSLNPPYFIFGGDEVAGIPSGAVLEGRQARWTWTDWEPGPGDDFALLLMHPRVWAGLQADRSAVENAPGSGSARWKLCRTYYGLSRTYPAAVHPAYSEAYLPQGVESCQVAADLLPADAAPHYVLAWFYLSALAEDPSPDTLHPVVFELELGRALEALQPASEVVLCPIPWDLNNTDCIEENIRSLYPGTPDAEWYADIVEEAANQVAARLENATATAEGAVRSTEWAHQTGTAAVAALAAPTRTSQFATSTPQPATLTPLPVPTATLTPLTPTPAAALPVVSQDRGGLVLIVAAGVIVLIIGFFSIRASISRRR